MKISIFKTDGTVIEVNGTQEEVDFVLSKYLTATAQQTVPHYVPIYIPATGTGTQPYQPPWTVTWCNCTASTTK